MSTSGPATTTTAARPSPTVQVLGVRHHGPGSARAVRAALDRLQPDRILVEGPPEADSLVGLAGDPDLVPPVALLVYRNDRPAAAAFWPFAVFSPEWQALTWGARRGVPVTFMDLPAATMLAGDDSEERRSGGPVHTDPIAVLAEVAGYDDPERWWEDVVESRGHRAPADSGTDLDPTQQPGSDPALSSAIDPFSAFEAITEAMTAVRDDQPETDPRTLQREAHMRRSLRSAMKTGAQRIAVICGAWHAPALTGKLPSATSDTALLRGLPTAKVTATWVPWTHSRLALSSGYGAGVDSPGWYRHLFTAGEHGLERWMTRSAGVLRAHDLPTSTAHVIEAVRLARSLAQLRDRAEPGLSEVVDATRAVLCEGNEAAVGFVLRDAVVGEELGRVPDSAPMVPLEADLRATVKSLRLRYDPTPKEVVLDLRQRNDLGKSRLFWRLRILDVPWAVPLAVAGTGTFKEGWTLSWRPELTVRLVVASMWGTTVAAAAAGRLVDRVDSLAACTAAIADCIAADLPDVLDGLLAALDRFAAGSADIAALLAALPELVRAQRYGTVRGTDVTAIAGVAQGVLVRICAGLPSALGGLDDDAARAVLGALDRTHDVVPLLPEGPARDGWYDALQRASGRRDLPPLLGGRIVRMLMDVGTITRAQAADRLHAALSVGSLPVEKAAWVEGFVAGGALLLIHDDELLAVLDRWVRSLADGEFLDVVPLLRRSFGSFAPAERGNLLRAVGSLSGSGRAAAQGDTGDLDLGRAHAVLATARLLLRGAS
ncbi:hypothetical protein JL107_08435 [Nakamurella flavida]|uniref:Uncharacterized protein n=1 Tax=Nakamurella flavida TaxID=363630 RepID=A0A938YF01_9ACTN|nr:DUF5682 family protein [Nakamurella flavida]MBM9476465.1 hypothetical protein [Nakamurella flavida]MDP9779434.1 hypothetical protein [Nakamurella flavida]